MTLIKGLKPILPDYPRLLILGSMPSEASLRAGVYYAHPQNAFWPVMMAILSQPPPAPDKTSCAAVLHKARIAVWDVLAMCDRRGSLDSAIKRATEKNNDIDKLTRRYSTIGAIALNGGRAKECFYRHIKLSDSSIRILSLPSTSAANARYSFAQKLAAWQVIKPFIELPLK